MKHLERILGELDRHPDHPFVQEARGGQLLAFPGSWLAERIRRARAFLSDAGVRPGDRVALLGTNSAGWVAADLAIIAHGAIVVPLYARSQPAEMAALLRDATPTLVLVESAEQAAALRQAGVDVPIHELAALEQAEDRGEEPPERDVESPVAILYTSGTSGEPKGVVLTGANLDFMLERTNRRLDGLMGREPGPDRVFHYLPFCFAGSWILLLASLGRRSVLTLNTDLSAIVEDLALAKPHYFQNVPVLLERMREGITRALARRPPTRALFRAAERAQQAEMRGETPRRRDFVARGTARAVLFPTVRRRLGPRLRALICGSAPLTSETQGFFDLIGIPVLQVYGLTETTAILTMDEPDRVVPGRVGRAVEGVEMRLGEHDEILARGPNVFGGYWNRPDATSASFTDGWFRTGDQGEVDAGGNWRVIGRIKNLIVPTSGHNVAPEPLEEAISARLPAAQQVVVIGDAKPWLAVLVTGSVRPEEVERALEEINVDLPHYRRVRGSLVIETPFTAEDGLLTANGKLRRAAIGERFRDSIDALYAQSAVSA
ncbi:MAG: AMP-binding protein [Gemmatimonadetes bacterium]|nr:AMP-binding protein [Gemmatimonadota bacterium]